MKEILHHSLIFPSVLKCNEYLVIIFPNELLRHPVSYHPVVVLVPQFGQETPEVRKHVLRDTAQLVSRVSHSKL